MEFTGYGFLLIDTKEHFDNHICYLFRTEKSQIRVNHETKNNLLFLPDGKKVVVIPFSGKLEERRMQERKFLDSVKDIPFGCIAMGRFEWEDPHVFYFTERMKDKVIDMFSKIEQSEGHVLLAVGHVDQMEHYVHIHFLVRVKEK